MCAHAPAEGVATRCCTFVAIQVSYDFQHVQSVEGGPVWITMMLHLNRLRASFFLFFR